MGFLSRSQPTAQPTRSPTKALKPETEADVKFTGLAPTESTAAAHITKAVTSQ